MEKSYLLLLATIQIYILSECVKLYYSVQL